MREMGPGILLRPAERDDLAAVEQLLTASGLPLAGVGEAFANFVVAEHEGYFPSFGFSVVERATVPEEIRNTVEFVDACPASAVVMERRL